MSQTRRETVDAKLMGVMSLGVGIALTGCVVTDKPSTETTSATSGQIFVGWYMEHAGQGSFQPCGQSQPLRVSSSADLPVRAKNFDLGEDTPIYVRVTGSVRGDEIAVARVEQFGSPTPVRNCAMNGVVIPSPKN
jgi:hypothetical protein